MVSAPDGHHRRKIDGTDGELIDRFMELIDRSPAEYPHWWFDYGALAGVRVGIGLPQDVDRAEAMDALRTAIERIVEAGLNEAFLVRALRTDLDAFANARSDIAGYDSKIEEMLQHLARVIEDPVVRDGWRRSRAKREPKWLTMTDEEVIADARAGYESFSKKFATADEAADRWAATNAWRAVADELLPDPIFEHWSHLNIYRASEG